MMIFGIDTLLVAALVVCAGLGVAGWMRRMPSVLGRRDHVAYWLSGVIAACALFGIWQYTRHRAAVARVSAKAQNDLQAFVAIRPGRLRSAESSAIRLTFTVPCGHLTDAARIEICAPSRGSEDRSLSSATRDGLRAKFITPIHIGLWPAAHLRIRPADEAPLNYELQQQGTALALATPDQEIVSVAIRGSILPVRQTESTPMFMDAAGAHVRVTLPPPTCERSGCSLSDIRISTSDGSALTD